ncbi:MAG: response regulator, partial [Deltaproteobacteria bacterium]
MKRQVRILLVEDEPESLNLLEKQLQTRGELVTVSDPRRAAEIAEEGSFDLLIAAGHLLGEAPWEFFSRVAAAAPQTLRVLSARHREAARTLRLVQRGLLHYHLPKPLRVRMLKEVLPPLLAFQRTLPS